VLRADEASDYPTFVGLVLALTGATLEKRGVTSNYQVAQWCDETDGFGSFCIYGRIPERFVM